eukprot:m.308454 g.308454  ORF g.308454 m.308454 type:complete len:62 (+) comp44030_c0_seq1:467-652(+)
MQIYKFSTRRLKQKANTSVPPGSLNASFATKCSRLSLYTSSAKSKWVPRILQNRRLRYFVA